MGAFGTAFTLATDIDVIPMVIYTEFTLSANLAMASALSIVLGIVTWILSANRTQFIRLNRGCWRLICSNQKSKYCSFDRDTVGLCVSVCPDRSVSCSLVSPQTIFKGVSSGLTLKWVYKVWELYADSIFLSIWLAFACLVVTLIIGLPAAYGLARHPGWLSRLLGRVHLAAARCARYGDCAAHYCSFTVR